MTTRAVWTSHALGAEYGGEFGLEQLERDLSIVLEILAQVHGGHAAFAWVVQHAITAG